MRALIPVNHTFVVPGNRFREICEYHNPTTPGAGLTHGLQATGIVTRSSRVSPSSGHVYYLNQPQPPSPVHTLNESVKVRTTLSLSPALRSPRHIIWHIPQPPMGGTEPWYNRTFPTPSLETSPQWNSPTTRPSHQYIALEASRSLPSNLTANALPQPGQEV